MFNHLVVKLWLSGGVIISWFEGQRSQCHLCVNKISYTGTLRISLCHQSMNVMNVTNYLKVVWWSEDWGKYNLKPAPLADGTVPLKMLYHCKKRGALKDDSNVAFDENFP